MKLLCTAPQRDVVTVCEAINELGGLAVAPRYVRVKRERGKLEAYVSHAEQVKQAEARPAKVVQMRRSGMTFEQIAAELRVGKATVHADWQKAKAA